MEYTTQELLIGIQEKDTEVFRYLYKHYSGMIAGYVRKNSGSEEDAVEMIQVVMLELWMAVQNGRYNEEGKLANYIYQLTSNTWRDELRKRKKRSSEALSDGELQLKDESELDLVHAIVKDKQLTEQKFPNLHNSNCRSRCRRCALVRKVKSGPI